MTVAGSFVYNPRKMFIILGIFFGLLASVPLGPVNFFVASQALKRDFLPRLPGRHDGGHPRRLLLPRSPWPGSSGSSSTCRPTPCPS
ncbi:MAG: hypothetical protein M0C28_40440 [Candidatus Moduliflexus flocculans]|nr:hypothetical protein [Candidatus Moduliflexus flocculans]